MKAIYFHNLYFTSKANNLKNEFGMKWYFPIKENKIEHMGVYLYTLPPS